jgi:hypothetical protein
MSSCVRQRLYVSSFITSWSTGWGPGLVARGGGAPPGRLLKRTISSYTLKLYDWRSSYVVPLSALDCAGSHSDLPPILGLHRGPMSILREPQHLRFSWRHAQSQFSYLADRACHRVFGEVGSLMPPTSPGKYQSIIRIAHQVRTKWPWAAQHSVVCIDPEDGSQHRSLWDPLSNGLLSIPLLLLHSTHLSLR